MNIKKETNRHNENFTLSFPNRNHGGGPKNEHKQRGRRPNGDCKTDDEAKHSFNLLSFSGYIIAHLIVKKQHIYDEVYVKFAAGPFLNIKLTTIKDGRQFLFLLYLHSGQK